MLVSLRHAQQTVVTPSIFHPSENRNPTKAASSFTDSNPKFFFIQLSIVQYTNFRLHKMLHNRDINADTTFFFVFMS